MNTDIVTGKSVAHRASSGLIVENSRYQLLQKIEKSLAWPTVVIPTQRKHKLPSKQIKAPNVDRQNPDGNAALHYAAFKGELGQTRLLILAGAEVNIANLRGDSPLICAAYNGHCDVVMALVAAGAELNAQDEDGRTALSWAAIRGQTDVVRLLISLGADYDICDNVDNSPLLWAVIQNHRDICKLLIEAERKHNL